MSKIKIGALRFKDLCIERSLSEELDKTSWGLTVPSEQRYSFAWFKNLTHSIQKLDLTKLLS